MSSTSGAPPVSDASRGGGRWSEILSRPGVRWGIAISVTAYVFVAAFPSSFWLIQPGLDESWVWAINTLPSTDLIFGRDVAFTYGPLGYLIAPAALSGTAYQAAAFDVVTQLVLAGVMIFHYSVNRRLLPLVGFAVLYLFAVSQPLPPEFRLLLLEGLLLTIPPTRVTAWRLAMVAAALLAVVQLFAKFTGFAAVGMLALMGGILVVRKRVSLRSALAWLVVPFFLTLIVLGTPLFEGAGNFLRWLRAGYEGVQGYAWAMALPYPPLLLWLGLLGLVGLGALLVWIGRSDRDLAFAGIPLLVAAMVAFRQLFTRSEGHPFFLMLMAVVAVVILGISSRKHLVPAVGAGVMAIVLFTVGAAGKPICPCPGLLSPANGWVNLAELFDLPGLIEDHRIESRRALSVERLPAEWVSMIRSSGRTADSLPADLLFLKANHLPWQPDPVLQTYFAYTTFLDRWAGSHFADPDGPEFVIAQWINIDGRHPMLDAPAVWRSIIRSYEVAGTYDAFGGLTLLRRRPDPLPSSQRVIGRQQARIGEWIEVPDSPRLLFAAVRFNPNLSGRLAGTFWRVDPMFVDLRYADGRLVTWRILPTTTEDGLLMNPLPSAHAEVEPLFSGTLTSRVLEIQFHGPGEGSFDPELEVVWREGPFVPLGH